MVVSNICLKGLGRIVNRFYLIDIKDNCIFKVRTQLSNITKSDGFGQFGTFIYPFRYKALVGLFIDNKKPYLIMDKEIFEYEKVKISLFSFFLLPFFVLTLKFNERTKYYFGLTFSEKNELNWYDDIVEDLRIYQKDPKSFDEMLKNKYPSKI